MATFFRYVPPVFCTSKIQNEELPNPLKHVATRIKSQENDKWDSHSLITASCAENMDFG